MEDNKVKVFLDAVSDAASQHVAPQVLGLYDQAVESYESLGPVWIDLTFKRPMRLRWDVRALFKDAVVEERDIGLTIAGLALSRASEKSAQLVESVLATLGFGHMRSSHYNDSTLLRNDVSDPARTFAHMAVEVDGRVMHVVCAVFRGTSSVEDILTDLKAARDGFYDAGKNCVDALCAYMRGIEGLTKKSTILYLTGHSLGAATANIVGLLTRGLVDESRKFVYTYASPNYECNGADELDGAFANYHTFTNAADVVPTVPHGFFRVGNEYRYDRDALDEACRTTFEHAYEYFCGVAFDDDNDPFGLGPDKGFDDKIAERYKNHVTATYMSLILAELKKSYAERVVTWG